MMDQIKRLLVAAAYQRRGDVQRAAEIFTEVASSASLPRVIADFQKAEKKEAASTKRETASVWPFRQAAATRSTPTPTRTAAAAWPFRQTASSRALAADDLEVTEEDMDVDAGIEEDFVDMGIDDAVLELSAADDDAEDADEADDEGDKDEEGEKEEAASEDEGDGEEEAPKDSKEEAQVRAFARTCRNLQALAEHAAKKKAKAKPVKKKTAKK